MECTFEHNECKVVIDEISKNNFPHLFLPQKPNAIYMCIMYVCMYVCMIYMYYVYVYHICICIHIYILQRI